MLYSLLPLTRPSTLACCLDQLSQPPPLETLSKSAKKKKKKGEKKVRAAVLMGPPPAVHPLNASSPRTSQPALRKPEGASGASVMCV